MAEVTLKWSDGGYSDTRAEDVFQVTGVADEYAAARASGPPWGQIPQLNSSHRSNSKLKAEVPFARQVGFNFYEVLVAYSVPEGAGDHNPPGGTLDPMNEPAQVEWSREAIEEKVDRDINGNPITNSAYDPFDPAPTRTFFDWILVISRNESHYDWTKAIGFQNTVNSNTFEVPQPNGDHITFHPGSVLCESILPTGRLSVNATYVNVAYRFRMRSYPPGTSNSDKTVERSPFQLWLADVGYRAIYTEGGASKPGKIVDGTGEEVSVPVRLNGSGVPMNAEHKVTTQKLPAVATATPTGAVKVVKGDVTFLVYQNFAGSNFVDLAL